MRVKSARAASTQLVNDLAPEQTFKGCPSAPRNRVGTTLMSLSLLVAALVLGGCATAPINSASSAVPHAAVLGQYVIDSAADYAQAHSSSLTETADGRLLATWFAGTHERHPDVKIYVAEFDGSQWSAGRVVATGEQADGSQLPTWNPVLFTAPDGAIWLFYKVGPNPRKWWGEVKISRDGGRTFGAARRLPDGILGPIKNKLLITEMGSWLAPSSREDEAGWQLVFESSFDAGKSWVASSPVASPAHLDAIQPSVLTHADGRLQAIARTRQGVLASSFSADRGRTWSDVFALALPNPSSGTDAVTLHDGRHLLIYNPVAHSPETPGKGVRYPLALAVSDDGLTWRELARLETAPIVSGYAYPAIMQTRDGRVQVSYTVGRKRIKHLVLDPAALQ